jgi:lysophospholipase L1-like esterase
MQAKVFRSWLSVGSGQCGLQTLAAGLSLAGFLIVAPARVATCAETAHNFEKWEKEISAYERMDVTNPPPKDALVFIGSSTILRWRTLAQDFPKHQVINRGFGGSEIVDSTHFAGRIIFPYQPRMVFLRAGGNDLWAGKSVEQVVADYKEFVARVHAKLPEADMVFISLSPSPARWTQRDKEKAVNTLIEEYTKQTPRLKYIEDYDMVLGADGKVRPELFVEDKLHFNAEGYKLLVERVRPYLPK